MLNGKILIPHVEERKNNNATKAADRKIKDNLLKQNKKNLFRKAAGRTLRIKESPFVC